MLLHVYFLLNVTLSVTAVIDKTSLEDTMMISNMQLLAVSTSIVTLTYLWIIDNEQVTCG